MYKLAIALAGVVQIIYFLLKPCIYGPPYIHGRIHLFVYLYIYKYLFMHKFILLIFMYIYFW